MPNINSFSMRRVIPLVVVLLALLPSALRAETTPPPSPVRLDYYFQPGCNDCDRVNRLVLPRLEEECRGRYVLYRHDCDRPEVFMELIRKMEQLGVNRNDTVSMIVDDRLYLGGYHEISRRLIPAVSKQLEPATAPVSPSTPRRFVFTCVTVAVAGLLDGINPCVFSTLVFFLSLLATVKVPGRKLLLAGSCYCLACFLTYLLLGFGLFRFLQLFSLWQWLRTTLEIAMAAVLLLFAVISFLDAWNYRRQGRAEAVKLQLPHRVKLLIHRIMRRNLTYRSLLAGAFLTGILVTLLEAVCTGQVYLPTLVLLTREAGAASVWTALLLLYNLMFILPLVVLFGGFFCGIKIPALLRLSKNNVTVSKTLLGVFFLLLAVLLLAFRRM